MNKRFVLLFCFLALTGLFSASAQDVIERNPQKESRLIKEYSKGKIMTFEYQKITARDIAIYNDHVEFTDRKSGKRQSFDLADVSLINVKKGSFAFEGMLLGGLGGLILPLGFHDQYGNYPKGEAFLICAAVGAGVGLIVGALIDDTKTVFQTGTLFISDKSNPQNTFPPALSARSVPIITFSIPID
ncbi:MAG: hypothetical protein ACM3U1_06005 [Chloroflexota bacterium]